MPEWEKYDKKVAEFQKKLNKRAATTAKSDSATPNSESTSDGKSTQEHEITEPTLSPEDLVEALDALGSEQPFSSEGESVRDEL